MAEKKNQHYVPQMHLRYFSTDNEKKLINVYHIQNKKEIRNVPIKKQASEDYFYGNDGVIEESLGMLESSTKEIFENIVNNHILPKKQSEEHSLLLLYVLFAKIRTRKQLDKFNEMNNLFFQKTLSYSPELKDIAPDYEIKTDNPFNLILSSALKSFYLGGDLEFKLIENKSKFPFILSDNPSIAFNDFNNQKGHEITNGKGLCCKGLQFFFPLSPNLLVFFYDSWAYKFGSKKSRVVSIDKKENIEQLNLLQILNANEIIFYNQETSKEYIESLINKAEKYDVFDKQNIEEFLVVNEPQSKMHLLKNSSPKLKLQLDSYKFQEKAKYWKPDSRLVYFRSEWHMRERERIRN